MFVFTLEILLIQALLYHCVYLGRRGEERREWDGRREGGKRRGGGGGNRWKGKGEEGRGGDENDYKEFIGHSCTHGKGLVWTREVLRLTH